MLNVRSLAVFPIVVMQSNYFRLVVSGFAVRVGVVVGGFKTPVIRRKSENVVCRYSRMCMRNLSCVNPAMIPTNCASGILILWLDRF